MNLTALAGNQAIKRRLGEGAGLSHAYLLTGQAGTGRHTLARLLAAAALCQAPEEENRPCARCPHCKKVAADIHPDVIVVAGEGVGKPPNVEAVRRMRSDAYIRPNEGRRKVYLLEEADRMHPSAQNALLKVLEDGPGYALFLLIAGPPGGVLDTVRSRCQELPLAPLTPEECREELGRRFPNVAEPERQAAVRQCGGSLGAAAALLSGAGETDKRLETMADTLVRAMAGEDEFNLFEASRSLEELERGELSTLLELLLARLEGLLERQPSSRRLWRGVRLARSLGRAAEQNVNSGQLAGFLCAGMFLEDGDARFID